MSSVLQTSTFNCILKSFTWMFCWCRHVRVEMSWTCWLWSVSLSLPVAFFCLGVPSCPNQKPEHFHEFLLLPPHLQPSLLDSHSWVSQLSIHPHPHGHPLQPDHCYPSLEFQHANWPSQPILSLTAIKKMDCEFWSWLCHWFSMRFPFAVLSLLVYKIWELK